MLKKFLRIILFPNTYSSEQYLKYLRKKGCQIGNNCKIWSPNQTYIDVSRPYLISIGSSCKITRNVTILTHDFSTSVLIREYKNFIGDAKEVVIGNNCFIGNNTTILMGTSIGNNCIIGAGSVVKGRFPDNVVIAGNPAKVICNLSEYYLKKIDNQIIDAKWYAWRILERTKRIPTIKQMGKEFSWLYLERNDETLLKFSNFFELSGENVEEFKNMFLNSTPVYKNFNDFLIDCGILKNE